MLPISFAPLQGYTEDVYRRFHHQLFGGVAEYYSPFVRLEHGKVRSKDIRDINPDNNQDVHLIPQLMAASAAEAEALLCVVQPLGYKRIDLNMGCPFTLQTRHSKGAGILIHPEKVQELMSVVRAHPEVEFSVKMRLGLESADDWKSVLPILNDAPLRHITLHPRTATQQYDGAISMSAFEEFLSLSKHPIVYNGDIHTVAEIEALEGKYPELAGVMIGRGMLARPSLALEYTTHQPWDDRKLLQGIHALHSHILEQYSHIIPNEQQLLMKVRTFWDFLDPSLSHSSLLDKKSWKRIKKAGNMKNYLEAVRAL